MYTYQDARCDSANGVTGDQSTAFQHDFEDTQTVAAGSVYDPWSSMNRRLELDHTTPFAQQVWLPQPYAVSIPDTFNHLNQALTRAFFPLESFPHYDSPEFASPRSSSSSLGTTLPSHWVASPSASAYSTMPTTAPEDCTANNKKKYTISCGECGKEYTGKHSRGNLARHERHKHGERKEAPYLCLVQGCRSVFERSDARLKHTRRRHPELGQPPVQRQQGTEFDGSSASIRTHAAVPQDLAYNVGQLGQWLSAEQRHSRNHMPAVQHEADTSDGVGQLPSAAKCVLSTLRTNLEFAKYVRARNAFFARWDGIVQQLQDDESDAYSVYAKVIEDIRAVMNTMDDTAYDLCAEDPSGYRSRAPPRTGPRGNGKSNVGHNTTTSKAAQHDRISKQSYASSSGKHVLVALDERNKKAKGRTVDCPVYKHSVVTGSTRSCGGCAKTDMSKLRSHFRTEGSHGGFPPCVHQCSRCLQDFIDEQLYDYHIRSSCDAHPQIRGDIVLSWGRLYLTLYPDALGIPEPWTDATGWLSDAEVRRCRAPLAASSSFLGARSNAHQPQAQMPLPDGSPSNGPVYDAAINEVLNDFVYPMFPQPLDAMDPTLSEGRHSSVATTAPRDPHFRNVQQGFMNLEGSMREGAANLTEDELGWMANRLTYLYQVTVSQQAYMYPPQIQLYPATDYGASSVDTQSSTHATSSQSWTEPHYTDTEHMTSDVSSNQYITPGPSNTQYMTPEPSGAQYMTPNASTQPSSFGNATGSSGYVGSSTTYPSSASAPGLLSPYSPLYRRQSGSHLSSPLLQNSVALRRSRPSRRSLPEAEDDHNDDQEDRPSPYRPSRRRR